jgi:hypothetical protein
MALDPESFRSELGDIYWRFFETPRHGQFDIATPSGENWGPEPAALVHLEAALARLDQLFDLALPAAERGWAERYKAPPRSRDAWSIVRLFADATGRIVLSLNEGEFDTYCLWDVTLVDGLPASVVQRAWGGASYS